MTREEAIAELNVLHERLSNPKDCEDGCYSWEDGWYVEAIDMAIEALQAEPTKAVPPSLADVYKWERDIALSQLEEYGIGFAEKKRDDLVEVVRCKDCKHRYGDECPMRYVEWVTYDDDGYIEWDDIVHDHTMDDGYCSFGEREDGEA